ncbi:hypothetical protein ACJX0J_007942, partial [Zea mays]
PDADVQICAMFSLFRKGLYCITIIIEDIWWRCYFLVVEDWIRYMEIAFVFGSF